jgi:hypothetical protein
MISKENLIRNVVETCKNISSREEVISFLGFKDGFKNSRTKLILHNSFTNETYVVIYHHFLYYKSKGKVSSFNKQKLNKDRVISEINDIIKSKNKNWKLLDFKYINANSPCIRIFCNEIDTITGKPHGEFNISIEALRHGRDCPKCSGKHKYSTEEFVERSNIIYNNKYLYDKTFYINSKEKLIITCPEHGDFLVTPDAHLNGGCGCPRCKNKSFGENSIIDFLKNNSIPYLLQFPVKSEVLKNCPNRFEVLIDFKIELNNKEYWIEYNGEQHYHYIPFFHENTQRTFSEQVQRDLSIRNYALENGIEFLEIPYLDIDRIPEILQAFLFEGKDITTKIERDDYSEDF